LDGLPDEFKTERGTIKTDKFWAVSATRTFSRQATSYSWVWGSR